MRDRKITKSELARRLDWHPPQVDRLLEMTHGSKLEQLECAFNAMGKRLVIGIEDEVAIAALRHRARRWCSSTVDTRRAPQRMIADNVSSS